MVEEWAQEVGVFEREVKLGTRGEPANVGVDRVFAKLLDGVLVVTLPKIIIDPERLGGEFPSRIFLRILTSRKRYMLTVTRRRREVVS